MSKRHCRFTLSGLRYYLAPIFLLLLAACNNDSGGVLENGSADLQMSPPAFIAEVRAIDQSALVLQVTVDGVPITMTRDGVTGQWSGIAKVRTNTTVKVDMKWSEALDGRTLELAKLSKEYNVPVAADSARLIFENNEFDTSADDDGDGRSNLAERSAESDPFDDSDTGEPVVSVGVNLRIELPDPALAADTVLIEQVTPLATFNGAPVLLTREQNSWTGIATATKDSDAFVKVDFFSSPDRSVLIAEEQVSRGVGDGTTLTIVAEDYDTTRDSDQDGLTNLQEVLGGSNPYDRNSPPRNPCEVSQFNIGCTIDTDGDGDADSQETATADSDGDGTPNYLESSIDDIDDDGRSAEADIDDNDPCVPSVNNIVCQDINRDTDGDGEKDSDESGRDTDGDGVFDHLESSILDADNDGSNDETDPANNDPCVPDANSVPCVNNLKDTDGDGKTDVQEGTTADTDGDGKADYLESSTADADQDGRVDELDRDDADPCIPLTNNTACQDINRDTDGDGEKDVDENGIDTDGDGKPDNIESSLLDADGDGANDENDADDADPCVPDAESSACQDSTQDSDGDGKTDASEGTTTDTDGDGKPDYLESSIADADDDERVDELDRDDADPCIPLTTNAACQAQNLDSDGDGKTDIAETLTADTDDDGVFDYLESALLDADVDGTADELDPANADPCLPNTANTACQNVIDSDDDTIIDRLDNCPTIANTDQSDLDTDGDGDVCDTDMDGDTVANASDNCPAIANANQLDTDSDEDGDACDTDDDDDTILDAADNCPLVENTGQLDTDGDDDGDACDTDDDNDTIPDDDDNCPLIANTDQEDLNENGVGDACES